jgi:hypothetical protein
MIPSKDQTPPTIAERLFFLLQAMLKESDSIPSMYHGVVVNLVKPYLRKAKEDELRNVIINIRDNVIPWILGE